MTKCNCRSSNAATGLRPEVLLPPPAWLQEMRGHAEPERPVSIDACIAESVAALWAAGHMTLGSCCGHGKARPALVLHEDERDFAAIRAALATVDDREWQLLQWQLVEVDS